MTLTTRLSLFFMTMLGVILIGFSATLYLLSDRYLQHQLEDRLESALNTLVAAVDVGPAGVEWERGERRLSIGPAAFGGDVLWFVTDEHGHVLDRSGPLATEEFVEACARSLRANRQTALEPNGQIGPWQARQRWIQSENSEDGRAAAPTDAGNDGRELSALSITVGVSTTPIAAALRQLAGWLFGLSAGIWLAGLFIGRALCRRALLPVSRMADAAREMGPDDLGRRLPTAAARDELGELNRSFNGLLDRLQESFERQRRFTGDASHQLRTPLAAILGQIEVALRRERSVEEYQRVLATVHGRSAHLGRIAESLLFLARSDIDARLPDQETLDLALWLPQHLQSWSEHARFADIALEANGAPAVFVQVHRALLGELLSILIDNACKYSEPRTPIGLQIEGDESAVRISIKDHGRGIRDGDLPHLFTPFFRSEETRQRGIDGVGLGLSIAKRLAQLFGGDLTVAGPSRHGACFTVRLPRARPRELPVPTRAYDPASA